ncbi:hypothetical protein F511_30484 [Dorcoceras hygrometricum]|uniref:Uncharacterized protein n=1 Tax=Dorcoceras hygrometricum TaxID=472368 RepID=A0A2Z7BNG8_9LAMI|nr:hypothetical protein F511_30484 [Dorcoceras hygrometricum]
MFVLERQLPGNLPCEESDFCRYSRSKKLRRIASWSWSYEEDQLERFEDDISSDVIIQQEDSADEKKCARYGMSCDDISLDVITISSWLSADEAKRKRRCDVVLRFSRCYLKIVIAKRCRLHNSRSYRRFRRNAKISRRNVLSIQTQEDSGEAFDEQDASNSSIQSKSLYESAVANQPVASFASSRHEFPDSISHTVEAVVHLSSLGVLTTAGCGIGSVHAVVRSNLLVEPSEVEEGEM